MTDLKYFSGDRDIPVFLGPMAGVTDLPFRLISREMGCTATVTEMVSAKALFYKNKNTALLLETGENEHPVGVQLFGSEPDLMAEMALMLEERFDFIDINMGCPVPKVVKNGEGSALLCEPHKVEQILSKMTGVLHKPVTVKIRKGFKNGEEQCFEIAKIAEACGISLVTLHARTREQYYSGKADWNVIKKLKESVKIPVIGNGDIFSAEDALSMLKETGCDGIMVARGAQGNPWIFREINAALSGEPVPERPDYSEIKKMILKQTKALCNLKGEYLGVLEMRKHASWYLMGQKNAAKIRRSIHEVNTAKELEALLNTVDVL